MTARPLCWKAHAVWCRGCATCSPDTGYAGDKLRDALKDHGEWTIEIVQAVRTRPRALFCCPRRWVVERTLAWLNRNRRLAKDVEREQSESAVTWLYIASVKLMSRRLAPAYRWM